MARTWSVPQRGSVAAISGLENQRRGSSLRSPGGLAVGYRGLILLFAAALTVGGVAVPHLDLQLFSTIFFITGAGLATLVVVLPWQSPSLKTSAAHAPTHRGGETSSALCPETERQLRFPELLTDTTGDADLDPAVWAKLTAHMSHELRTPLNAVLGFSEIMRNEVFGPLGDNYSAYARDIHTSGRSLLKTAEDALAITALLTTPERKRARTSRIKNVVNDACSFAAPDLAERSIAVAIDIGGDVEIVGDHQATRQMLINLIAEASRHAASGAVLRIDTKSQSETVNLSLTLVASDSGAQSDEGFGIILARTFCELSGAELTSGATDMGEWTSTVRLPRAAQADLFAFA